MTIPQQEQQAKRNYYLSLRRQLLLWCNGISKHDDSFNECCPDFSCCHPELAEPDMVKRRDIMCKILDNHAYAPRSEVNHAAK